MSKNKIKLRTKLKVGWDAPFSIGFIISFLFLGASLYFALFMVFSLISYALFYQDAYDYWVFVLTITFTFFAFVLLQIPIYNAFYRLNYLHYCKSMILSQVLVFFGYLFMLYWAYAEWMPYQGA